MKNRYRCPGFLAIYTALVFSALHPWTISADETMLDNKVVIAHRGASGYLPEHTLEAKALAYAMGADFVEQDLVLTRDGIPVVMHDLDLNDTTNVEEVFPNKARMDGKYYVIDFDLAEIKQLNVHERTRQNGNPKYPGRFPTDQALFKVPTLSEEIEMIQGLNISTGKNVGLYTEIKSPAWHREQGYDFSSIVLNILSEYGYDDADDNILFQCFDPAELLRIRYELNSELRLVQLIGENAWNEADTDYNKMRTEQGLKIIAEYASGIGPTINQIVKYQNGKVQVTSLVKQAKKLGLVVHPYTLRKDSLPDYVSSFDELLEILFVKANVDGVFTDHPDLAVQFKNR